MKPPNPAIMICSKFFLLLQLGKTKSSNMMDEKNNIMRSASITFCVFQRFFCAEIKNVYELPRTGSLIGACGAMVQAIRTCARSGRSGGVGNALIFDRRLFGSDHA